MTTRRRLGPGRIVAATHNPGKVVELAALLRPLGCEPVSAGELGLPEPDETALTFEGNAELKAHAAAKGANCVALADDSGLEVIGLDGAPGIYSARWAGPTKDFRIAMDRIATELAARQATDMSARFVCVLSVAWPDGHCESFRGEVEGRLTFPPRGDRGFGYDPVFIPAGETETFGEMEPARKDAMSHRAHAFARLKAALLDI